MSDKYIKLSQIEPTELDNFVPDNPNQLKLFGLSNNAELLDITNAIGYSYNKNDLLPDSFKFTLMPNINNINFNISYSLMPSGKLRKLYYDINNNYINYLDLDDTTVDNTFNFQITEGSKKFNSVTFSPVVLNESEIPYKNDNLVTNLIVNDPNITSIELNLPSLRVLHIYDCVKLDYINISNSKNLNNIIILNNFTPGELPHLSGVLKLGTLIPNQSGTTPDDIDIRNNFFNTIILEGNGKVVLNSTCCHLIPQVGNRLGYVKFKNCIVEDDLIQELTNAGVNIEIYQS